jgi:hypothetical protein
MQQPLITNEVHFAFGSEAQFKTFVAWFKKQGFGDLILSKTNVNNPAGKDEQISCLSTDEKMEWGHYFELE